jgi:hypothetical protein
MPDTTVVVRFLGWQTRDPPVNGGQKNAWWLQPRNGWPLPTHLPRVTVERCYEYRDGPAVSFTDDRDKFRSAERRVRHLLFGDGVEEPGRLKGEQVREEVTRALRRMREAFDAIVAGSEEGQEKTAEAEARVAGLEEELTRIAAAKGRSAHSAGTS